MRRAVTVACLVLVAIVVVANIGAGGTYEALPLVVATPSAVPSLVRPLPAAQPVGPAPARGAASAALAPTSPTTGRGARGGVRGGAGSAAGRAATATSTTTTATPGPSAAAPGQALPGPRFVGEGGAPLPSAPPLPPAAPATPLAPSPPPDPLPAPAPLPPPVAPPPAAPPAPPVPRFAGLVVRVADRDLPDPFVLRAGGMWWVYATGTGGANLQVASSSDLRTWGPSSDPLTALPRWAAAGFTWAPAVLPRSNGYVLYYAVRDAALGRQCISAAVGGSPAGPFVDTSAGPLVCQSASGGSIDPDPFVAPDGTAYLLWKSDDNALGTRTQIGGQLLSGDGLRLVGPRPALLAATNAWDDGVVEGPAMVAVGGRDYLFYGANHWDTPGAGIGYAVCSTPLGPCADHSTAGPWLATQGPIVGPSGAAPFVGDGVVHLAFAAWAAGPDGQQVRALWIGTLTFSP